MGADSVAEGGASAGSNFFINRYDDTGAFVGTALSISRSTGDIVTTGNLSVGKWVFCKSQVISDAAKEFMHCSAKSLPRGGP